MEGGVRDLGRALRRELREDRGGLPVVHVREHGLHVGRAEAADDARSLLVLAFASEIVDRMKIEPVREQVRRALFRALPERLPERRGEPR